MAALGYPELRQAREKEHGVPIPPLEEAGYLPAGIYDADLAEVEARFGSFQTSDRRVVLFQGLKRYAEEAARWGRVEEIILDGSFISKKDQPGDVDLIVVRESGVDLDEPVTPAEYNVISATRVRRKYGLEVFPVLRDSVSQRKLVAYFAQDTRSPGLTKGLVRVRL